MTFAERAEHSRSERLPPPSNVIAASLLRSATLFFNFVILRGWRESDVLEEHSYHGVVVCCGGAGLRRPSLSITNTGLDASGNWTWNVFVTPTGGSSLAVELGLRETFAGQQIIAAQYECDAARLGHAESGHADLQLGSTDVDGDYVGLQVNPQPDADDEIFAAIGSAIQANATQTQLLSIKTLGPTNTRLTPSLQLLGKHGTGSVNGRIAEGLGTPAGTNYSNFSGTATRTVKLGDANLDGNAGLLDLDTLGLNFNVDDNARTWTHADFNGDKDVGLLDLDILGQNFGQSGGVNTPLNIVGVAGGAGSLGGSVVPEPSTIALLMLGFGAVCTLRKRR